MAGEFKSSQLLPTMKGDEQMIYQNQQATNACESHVIEYVTYLEDALRQRIPAEKIELNFISAPTKTVFPRSKPARRATLSPRIQ